MLYLSNSEAETEKIAKELAKTILPGMVVCLHGELGAGKTVFARGFAKGLDITKHITSPTFCIVNEYTEGRLPFYHFDTYRVNAADMREIGFDDYVFGNGVCLIEWAENISILIPKEALWVEIKHSDDENTRVICIKGGAEC